jgi:DNA transposition AAA+ family ATPase
MSAERVDTIEWLRELKDETGCALILIGTTEAPRMMQGDGPGHESGDIFIQTLKRSLDPLRLKNNPPRRDLNAFARAVGLPPAEDEAAAIQDQTVRLRGLEIWLTYLMAGAGIAANENRAVAWADVVAAVREFSGVNATEEGK